MAITKYDQFDFLIDIVPRDELKPVKKEDNKTATAVVGAEQVSLFNWKLIYLCLLVLDVHT